MKIGVIGCGFVGLITAVGFASKGNEVTAIDIDRERISKIKNGIVPFHEVGVEKLLKSSLKKGNLKLFNSVKDLIDCEVIFICVQTPPKLNGAINLKILKKAAESLASQLKKGNESRVIVVRSTVVPGTIENTVMPIFRRINNVEVIFNPEFLREGTALSDFLNPDRIVIGTKSIRAGKIISKLYKSFNAPIIITTSQTAELSKYASNVLLATLISFSNEIARICENTPNTDVEDVLGITHLDRRFKVARDKSKAEIISYLKAGCGFGGSCLPKDLSALISYARLINENTPLLKSVATINKYQPNHLVDMASEAGNGLENKNVTVLGLAFKGGTDDLRESPGLKIINELIKRKANIKVYDPLVDTSKIKNNPGLFFGVKAKNIIVASSIKEAVEICDICIITTNAPEFKSIGKYLRRGKTIIIDGRRIMKVSKRSNKNYYAIGLPT